MGYQPNKGIILGLDQSPDGTGWGVVNWEAAPRSPLDYGVLDQSSLSIGIEQRWIRAMRHVRNLIRKHQPEAVVYEAMEQTALHMLLKHKSNVPTAKALLKMVGALEAYCDQIKIPYYGVTPQTWKRHVNIQMGELAETMQQKRKSCVIASQYYGLMLLNHNTADALNVLRWFVDNKAMSELRQGSIFQ